MNAPLSFLLENLRVRRRMKKPAIPRPSRTPIDLATTASLGMFRPLPRNTPRIDRRSSTVGSMVDRSVITIWSTETQGKKNRKPILITTPYAKPNPSFLTNPSVFRTVTISANTTLAISRCQTQTPAKNFQQFANWRAAERASTTPPL